ncbi:unnamed protein product [Tilletia controversa]|nr:unnamed protein product [Tilletia controversa]
MINLRLVGKGPEWHITKVDWTHNHDPDPLLQSQSKPHHPTQVENDLIRRLVSGNAGNISRSQALQCVLVIVPDTKLELQQVSNIINTAKNDRQVEYAKKGGDAASLLVWLAAQKDKDQGFRYACQVHKETGALRRLFVCSAEMVNALQRFGDVIIADVAQGRNIYQMPLNIFCVVDGAGRTRNVAYVVQDREDKEAHQWALEQLIITSGFEPSVVMSDQDSAFISAVRKVSPTSRHLLCLWHLWKNVRRNLLSKLRQEWPTFCNVFWSVYQSPSPVAFELRWRNMLQQFPRAHDYLESIQYPNRRSWAAAWTRTQFTANTRTTGRVESENGVNKLFSNRKTTLSELFPRLLERASQQSDASEATPVYLQGNPDETESYFQDVVDILRKHCTIGAIVVSMKAMKQAMFYRVTPVELPSKLANEDPKPTPSPERFVEVPTPDMTDDDDDESVMSWDGANNSDGDDGDNAEVQNELEPVQENEQQYEFDPSYLAAMVEASGTTLLRAYDIRRRGTPASRILLVADDGKFYCTCAEGIATGIPCRHMWAAIGDGEYFQLQQVNPRWHLDRLAAVDVKPVQLKVPILTVPFPKKTIPVRLPGEQDDFRPDYAAKGKIRVSDSYGRAAAGARSIAVVINTEERAREIEQMLADQRDKWAKEDASPDTHDLPSTKGEVRQKNDAGTKLGLGSSTRTKISPAESFRRVSTAARAVAAVMTTETRAEEFERTLAGYRDEWEGQDSLPPVRDPHLVRSKGRPPSARKKDPAEPRRVSNAGKRRRQGQSKYSSRVGQKLGGTTSADQVPSQPSTQATRSLKRARPHSPTSRARPPGQGPSEPSTQATHSSKRARPHPSTPSKGQREEGHR